MRANELIKSLNSESVASIFSKLYGSDLTFVRQNLERAQNLVQVHGSLFGDAESVQIFSSPGRTEVGGNHTDHNGGRVLAATVNVDILAAVSPSHSNSICIESMGYGEVRVDLNQLNYDPSEQFTPTALVKGVCQKLKDLGYSVGGFNAVMNSTIPRAAGLSSSAAFECLITEIQNVLFNKSSIPPILNAQISQFAENTYFGKPCGLMDQTTIAVGGLVTIDFESFELPLIRKVDVDFAKSGYSLVVVDTGGDHADLNDDYIALEHEMKSVAKVLGGEVLRQFSLSQVLDRAPELRKSLGDRAVLRAVHFYEDDARVVEQVKALENNEFSKFLNLVIESGQSSFMYCQNCYISKNVKDQGISLALAVSEQILKGQGAWRVHGGGFAGTIQAFVPQHLLDHYMAALKNIFGAQACHALSIRPEGTKCITL